MLAIKAKGKEDKLSKLNDLFTEAETLDKELFAEQKSNILLVAGEHYSSKTQLGMNNIRIRQDISSDQKIRLTRNHIQKICKLYVNTIVAESPATMFVPANPKELKDKKAADLREKIWKFGKRKHQFDKKVRSYARDFVHIGEVGVKVFFDPTKGDLQEMQDVLDENGQATGQQKPIFSGEFVFERLYGFNTLRHPTAKTFDESPVVILRKYTPTRDLKALAQGNEEAIKAIDDEGNEEFTIFDAQKGKYSKSKGHAMLREYYFRPCPDYPKGYFVYATKSVILAEGELPEGVFPIAFAGYEEIQTSPRFRSPIKHMRPYQVEINRKASKMAEHQVTLGDDKILLMNGSKMEQGTALPGIRGLKISGVEPKILPGRDGSQFLAGMQQDITELYDVMGMSEQMLEKRDGAVDPYAVIFKSAAKKKIFQEQIQTFQQFLREVTEIFVRLAPHYYDDAKLRLIVGADDQENLDELFRKEDLHYQIQMEDGTEDIESQMGQQMILTQAIQYSAQHMTREDIGKLISRMPFANAKDVFSDFTMDSDLADNIILALDRGKPPMVHEYDTHDYMIKRLISRIREPDFDTLPPNVQANYQQALSLHEQGQAMVIAKQMQLKNEFIPTGGAMITCDMYVQDETSKNPNATRRVRVPYQALEWLIKALDNQGQGLASLEQMNAQAGNDVAGRAASMVHGGAQPPMGQGPGSAPPVQPTGGQGLSPTPGQA